MKVKKVLAIIGLAASCVYMVAVIIDLIATPSFVIGGIAAPAIAFISAGYLLKK